MARRYKQQPRKFHDGEMNTGIIGHCRGQFHDVARRIFSEYQARSSRTLRQPNRPLSAKCLVCEGLLKTMSLQPLHQQMIRYHQDPSKIPRFPCAPPRRQHSRDATPNPRLCSPSPATTIKFPRELKSVLLLLSSTSYTSLQSSCARPPSLFLGHLGQLDNRLPGVRLRTKAMGALSGFSASL